MKDIIKEDREASRLRLNDGAARHAPNDRAPVDMILFCPACGLQHIDEPEPSLGPRFRDPGRHDEWTNPPHRSHLCHGCGHIWRPADIATNGVAAIRTVGKSDSLRADFTKSLPGGALDDTTFEEVEAALDRADAPCQASDGRWLTLPERIAALTPSPATACSGDADTGEGRG